MTTKAKSKRVRLAAWFVPNTDSLRQGPVATNTRSTRKQAHAASRTIDVGRLDAQAVAQFSEGLGVTRNAGRGTRRYHPPNRHL